MADQDTKNRRSRAQGDTSRSTHIPRSQQPLSTGNEPAKPQIDGDEGRNDGGVERESPIGDIRDDRDVERERP